MQPKLGGPHGKVGQQLIAHKNIPERLHLRMREVGPGVSPEGVGRIGKTLPCRQRNNGGVKQHNRDMPDKRSAYGMSALDKPGALDKVIALFQFFNKPGNILDTVLIVAVHRENSLVASLKGPPQSHTELRPLLSGVLLHQKRIDAEGAKKAFFRGAVCGAAVTENDIYKLRDTVSLRSFKLFLNASVLIDNRDTDTVIRLSGGEFFCPETGNPLLLFINHITNSSLHRSSPSLQKAAPWNPGRPFQ